MLGGTMKYMYAIIPLDYATACIKFHMHIHVTWKFEPKSVKS